MHLLPPHAITCSQDGTVRFWSLETGEAVRVIHNRLHVQSMTVDERLEHILADRSQINIFKLC